MISELVFYISDLLDWNHVTPLSISTMQTSSPRPALLERINPLVMLEYANVDHTMCHIERDDVISVMIQCARFLGISPMKTLFILSSTSVNLPYSSTGRSLQSSAFLRSLQILRLQEIIKYKY